MTSSRLTAVDASVMVLPTELPGVSLITQVSTKRFIRVICPGTTGRSIYLGHSTRGTIIYVVYICDPTGVPAA